MCLSVSVQVRDQEVKRQVLISCALSVILEKKGSQRVLIYAVL
jgi:hypothetical protein